MLFSSASRGGSVDKNVFRISARIKCHLLGIRPISSSSEECHEQQQFSPLWTENGIPETWQHPGVSLLRDRTWIPRNRQSWRWLDRRRRTLTRGVGLLLLQDVLVEGDDGLLRPGSCWSETLVEDGEHVRERLHHDRSLLQDYRSCKATSFCPSHSWPARKTLRSPPGSSGRMSDSPLLDSRSLWPAYCTLCPPTAYPSDTRTMSCSAKCTWIDTVGYPSRSSRPVPDSAALLQCP